MTLRIQHCFHIILTILILALVGCSNDTATGPIGWPEQTHETKPWTRWWWHGSAVTKEGITHELEQLKNAGIGGVEITPIYGTYGAEKEFVQFLSDEWVDLLIHTLEEASRLDLGVDMATGTGWPFGGPWVGDEDASKNFHTQEYLVRDERSVPRKIEYVQAPYLRRVGFNVPYAHKSEIRIEQLKQPINTNDNLQELAIDQVQFQRKLPLIALMAFKDGEAPLNLTNNVSPTGKLQWEYPGGEWKLYALFQGWHGKLVERAGPGGEGNVIDHFSSEALSRYLSHFDSALHGRNISSLRAFFNDSYEVDDARGTADWTPELLEQFRKRRGYDLLHYLPVLHQEDTTDVGRRVLSDYRETVAELLLENFTKPWKEWANKKDAYVRNQAHGSPANILDMYSAVDIPEIEGIEPLRIRMASSAANVTGKGLVSAEAATWLDEHFESNLGDVKGAVDRFLLHGVNHIVYHGTAYSAVNDPWPGRLFYAAVHFNSRNPMWNDFKAFNDYVTRCQSFLQKSKAANDVLVYYPIYDPLSTPGRERLEHFDGIGRQFNGSAFERVADSLLHFGFSFDYISDSQIEKLSLKDTKLITEGGSAYSVIVVPHCKYIPLETFHKLIGLAEEGAIVLFYEGMPEHTAGFANRDQNESTFAQLLSKARSLKDDQLRISSSLANLFRNTPVRREHLTSKGIEFLRKQDEEGNTLYFIKNVSDVRIDDWIQLNSDGKSVEVFNPQSGVYGKGRIDTSVTNATKTYVQLQPRETLIIRVVNHNSTLGDYPLYAETGHKLSLTNPWRVEFKSGGPSLPGAVTLDNLTDWTKLGEEYAYFSGVAEYTTTFDLPQESIAPWQLQLGEFHESAQVYVNDIYVGTLFDSAHSLTVGTVHLKRSNTLRVMVSNSMANRIIYLEKHNVPWKKFYNINFPARKAENSVDGLFNASQWIVKPSGLIGPVTLIELSQLN